MTDRKDLKNTPEVDAFIAKIETGTPAQASMSVIAQIMQKLQELKTKKGVNVKKFDL